MSVSSGFVHIPLITVHIAITKSNQTGNTEIVTVFATKHTCRAN